MVSFTLVSGRIVDVGNLSQHSARLQSYSAIITAKKQKVWNALSATIKNWDLELRLNEFLK